MKSLYILASLFLGSIVSTIGASAASYTTTSSFDFLDSAKCDIEVNNSYCGISFPFLSFDNTTGGEISIRSDQVDAKNESQYTINRYGVKFYCSYGACIFLQKGQTFLGNERLSLPYGSHTLRVRKSDDTVLKSLEIKVSCESGSTWSDSLRKCLKNLPPGETVAPRVFNVSDCVIPYGMSTCVPDYNIDSYSERKLYVKIQNSTLPPNPQSPLKVLNFKSPRTYFIFDSFGESNASVSEKYGKLQDTIGLGFYGNISFGTNKIMLYEDDKLIAETQATATCEPGTIWTMFRRTHIAQLDPFYHNYFRCLPPFPDTPSGAREQTHTSSYPNENEDPEFGNINGFCPPWQKWSKIETQIRRSNGVSEIDISYKCQNNLEPVNPKDVFIKIDPNRNPNTYHEMQITGIIAPVGRYITLYELDKNGKPYDYGLAPPPAFVNSDFRGNTYVSTSLQVQNNAQGIEEKIPGIASIRIPDGKVGRFELRIGNQIVKKITITCSTTTLCDLKFENPSTTPTSTKNSTTPTTTPTKTNTSTNSPNTTPPKSNTPSTPNPNTDTTIVDTLDLDTSSLDLASKARIDKIVARVDTRVSKMIYQIALKFIDTSISRINALPNKTQKAKLIDTYTIQKLQALREKLVSENEEDYISTIDTTIGE